MLRCVGVFSPFFFFGGGGGGGGVDSCFKLLVHIRPTIGKKRITNLT